MLRLRSFQNSLAPVILVFSLTAIYVRTLAPGLTWANGGSDGGDLITAIATGGVAHPTGYPLYLLMARPFQYLAVGSLAFRTNLMSALAVSLAAALVACLVTRSTASQTIRPQWLPGLAAGFAFGLAPLVWSQAVITEVYGLQALLLALILFLYTAPAQSSSSGQKRLDYGRGLVLGLGMSNHVTTLLLVPIALLLGSIDSHRQAEQHSTWRNLRLDGSALLRQVATFGVGLSLYLILPVRALTNPPVNWGNAVTPQRLWWLVSGQLYQSHYLQSSLYEVWGRMQAAVTLLVQQFGLPGIALGLVGLIVFGYWSRLYVLTIWIAMTSTLFSVVYGAADSQVYLIPMFLSFAIWLGLGVAALSQQLTERSWLLRLSLVLLMIVYFAGRLITVMDQVDASQDLRAEAFGRDVLSAAPENAIVFAEGDPAVFALWYFHFALGERPDLAVLATDLLHFDWYQETLQVSYPALVIPGPFPWPETMVIANPLRAICYVEYSDHAEIECSTALTPP